jgi:hypothetical protein
VQGSNERLDGFPSHSVLRGVALGLDVNLLQAQRVLIDDAVHTPVACAADPFGALLRTAVSHLDQHVQDGQLQEVWVELAQPGEQLTGDRGVEPRDATLNLLDRVKRSRLALTTERTRPRRFSSHAHRRLILIPGRDQLKVLLTQSILMIAEESNSHLRDDVTASRRTNQRLRAHQRGHRPADTVLGTQVAGVERFRALRFSQIRMVKDVDLQLTVATFPTVARHLKDRN